MLGRIFVVLLLLCVAAGAGYYAQQNNFLPFKKGGQPPQGAGPMGGMPAMPVGVAEVLSREVQQWREYSGRLTASDFVAVRSRVSGPIESIKFQEGAMVKKGDLLFTIDPRPYAAELARAQAALGVAKAAHSLSETKFKRAVNLIKDKAIAQSDYDTRKNERDVTKAQVESAQAQLDTAKLNLDYTQIKSPIDGRVSRAELTVGNLVQAGQNGPLLTTVVSLNPIYADFDVDEATYLALAPEMSGDVSKTEVTLELAADGVSHKGVMQSFDNRLNPASGTLRARAVFKNDDGTLVPGLFARVRVGSASPQTFTLISDKAVGTDQSKKFVYVVGADNKVEYREVQLGDIAGGLRIVKAGLKPGEKIIVDGLMRAQPGAEVKPELVSMDGSPAAPAAAPVPAEQALEKPAETAPAEAPAAEVAPVKAVAPETPAPADKEETKK